MTRASILIGGVLVFTFGWVSSAIAGDGTGQSTKSLAHLPLDVAFVGTPDTARMASYTQFLNDHVQRVRFFARGDGNPSEMQQADVVLLDWPQGGRDPQSSPLGARSEWHTPTVLLGSAGLNLAKTWEVVGGIG